MLVIVHKEECMHEDTDRVVVELLVVAVLDMQYSSQAEEQTKRTV